tara:strand:- start:683 stop:1003 length:321 start_codon:yes stop_codon:yes gene_type:complete
MGKKRRLINSSKFNLKHQNHPARSDSGSEIELEENIVENQPTKVEVAAEAVKPAVEEKPVVNTTVEAKKSTNSTKTKNTLKNTVKTTKTTKTTRTRSTKSKTKVSK